MSQSAHAHTSRRQMCGYCGTAVLKHRDAHEEVVEGKSQLFHLRRCWPRERRRRHKLERQLKRAAERALELAAEPGAPEELKQAAVAAALAEDEPVVEPEEPREEASEDEEDGDTEAWENALEDEQVAPPAPPVKPPQKQKHRFQGRRGLQDAVFAILDPVDWATQGMVEAGLALRGLKTDPGTLQNLMWQYGQKRRPYLLMKKAGRKSIYRFDLALGVRAPEGKEEAPEPPPPPPVKLPEPAAELVAPRRRAKERAESPAAVIDRELNDFQAMLLEMVAALRADLKKLVKEEG